MKIVYLDCISGISGDMALAALVDAGADKAFIERELAKLPLTPYSIEWKTVNKNGISSLKADVIPDPAFPPVHHTHYSEIVRMIQEAGLPERTVERSLAIFEKIGIAEAKIHGIPLDRVHFHEVGAVDSIVDAVGVALALESLQADVICSSAVPLGCGTVVCAHGTYPVPAPATLEMMKGVPTAYVPIAKELTTPTGAGIISALVDKFETAIPSMTIASVGYGAGTRDLRERPNVLRVVFGQIDDSFLTSGMSEEQHESHHHHHGHHHEHHHHDHRHGHGHEHHKHEHDEHAHN
ncbi:LarC family nickel insertion protein [Paenibacillus sp. GCM10027626]|uniref:LarC family nickel insertion protein n=1 Tax=Paenibacillus sp. GCM10027626 TaxID=3273411 RepID=UPI00362A8491